MGYNDVNSAIIIRNFKGVHEGIPVAIPDAAINNLEKPIAMGSIHSRFDIKKLGNIFGDDVFKFNGGTATLDFKFDVNIVALKRVRYFFWGLSKKFFHSKEKELNIYHTSLIGSKEFYFGIK